jgi:ABC-type Na+ transport system ATPase subunit NatA
MRKIFEMRTKHYQKRIQILDTIDDATSLDKMTAREAIEFLGELNADIEGRIEALYEENELER